MNINLTIGEPKKIRLPNSLRVTSEMHVDENLMCWLIIMSHLQIITRSIMKDNVSILYVHRIRLLCKWIMNDAPPELAPRRACLSNWEACSCLFGPIIRAGISVKGVVIHALQNMIATDTVAFSYTHKFAGSAVAVSILCSDFISTNVYGDMAGFRSGLEPVIEQIHTVQREPNPSLSKFPDAFEMVSQITDAALTRRVQNALKVVPESDIRTWDDFRSLVVSVYNNMETAR